MTSPAAPKFVRVPEQDKRASRGDGLNANAWRDATGNVKLFCRGFDANAYRWLSLNDTAGRARIDGGL